MTKMDRPASAVSGTRYAGACGATDSQDLQRAFGMIMVVCPRYRHAMFYDEIEDAAVLRSDRCKVAIWPG